MSTPFFPLDVAAGSETLSIQTTPPPPLMRSFGYKPSRIGSGVPQFRLAAPEPAAVPDHYTQPEYSAVPVRDQGQRSTCVAEALRSAREALLQRGGTTARLSMEYLYDLARERDGDPMTPGLTPLVALVVLQEQGTPHELSYPDAPQDVPLPVPADRVQRLAPEAATFRCGPYGQITSFADLQAALLHGHSVVVGVLLTQASMDQAGQRQGRFAVLPDDPPVGGHCLVVTGYTPDSLQIRNSWGATWGDNGNGSLPLTYPNLFLDCWSFTAL